jgi:hypothetical protein
VAVAPLAALCALAAPAAAQPAGSGDPYKTVVVTAPSPYWGYTYNPYAVFVPGPGDIIRAQGDYLIKTQEASRLREEVRQKKLVTRQKQLEQWEREQEFWTGFPNRKLKREHQAAVDYALNYATPGEIVYAGPLNVLLKELFKRTDPSDARSTPVDAKWLDHVHPTVDGRGNLGLLKGDRIPWTQLLLRPDFDQERKQIEKFLAQAKEQALLRQSHPQIDPKLLSDLRVCVRECQERIDKEVRSGVDDPAWNTRHYVEAGRILGQVKEAIRVLEMPNAADHLISLQGKTVAELVAFMKNQGFAHFAPAPAGDERYYIALYGAFAEEMRRLQSLQPSANKP